MKKNLKTITILLIILGSIITTGTSLVTKTPQKVYRVYLKGDSLGIIKSKTELEDYINEKQIEIKKKYDVDKVYIPSDLDIVKEVTFNNNITSVESIYNKIKDKSPFTISGYKVSIKGVEAKTLHGQDISTKNLTIYVLDKEVFKKSIYNTVKAFIPEASYEAFANDTQAEITDTGEIIENIYIQNKITIKEQNIPVNKVIYQDEKELSQYLMFGTTDPQQTYTVKEGDTIAGVAFNNKVSTEEFLIANPEFTNENSLLYPGQKVTIGILKPQFNVLQQDYVVKREVTNYQTETRLDNSKYTNYSVILQNGIKGENKVTQRVTKINGQITNIEPLTTEVLKEPVKEIVIKGTRTYNIGWGTVVPVGGNWGWPASCSSISSYYGWRWGTLHDGIDIAGCGYGSNIFAAEAGVVVESRKKYGGYAGGYGDNGEYIIIDHQNGFFTIYAHLCPGCRYVKAGDIVYKGQPIGGMGRTGAATGVHLHFGLWRGKPYSGGSQSINPMTLY